MSKSVLISIRPEWCEMIANGKKTVEVRKTRPKLETPFKVYIYCTHGTGKNTFNVPVSYEKILRHYIETGSMKCLNCHIGNCKVIGEFACDRIFDISVTEEGYNFDVPKMTGLKYEEMESYLNRKTGYGWHISDLVIYDKPKELSEFVRCCKAYGKDIGRCWDCSKSVGDEHDCGANGMLEMKWPPKSWCYVEEPEGGMFE